MKIIRALLFPIVPIYYLVTWLRNVFYDTGIKRSKSYDFPVICVGNLSAGGTGKTPMVEYLIRLLKDEKQIATLSRGYGRKTKGFILANNETTADSIGDEPFQFYYKYNNVIQVAVDENRQSGIETLRNLKRQPEVVLLDDAYQHRKVKAGLNILLTTYDSPFYKDIVLPTGNLREPKTGASRAQIIVVTKCPDVLSQSQKEIMVKAIRPKPYQEVFFSSISYSKEVLSKRKTMTLKALSNFTLVTGIANAKPLVTFLKSEALKFEHLEYKDHHDFSQEDIALIAKSSCILTTEKDYMRLKDEVLLENKLFYIPITCLIENAKIFNKKVKGFVS